MIDFLKKIVSKSTNKVHFIKPDGSPLCGTSIGFDAEVKRMDDKEEVNCKLCIKRLNSKTNKI